MADSRHFRVIAYYVTPHIFLHCHIAVTLWLRVILSNATCCRQGYFEAPLLRWRFHAPEGMSLPLLPAEKVEGFTLIHFNIIA